MENQRTVNQYTLLRKIGQGGMAEVWEGRHILLPKRVAVKFLLPQFSGDPELQTRFLNEGTRQAALQHPNVVGVIDFFTIDGQSYLVLDYIDGISLETRLGEAKGPLPFHEIHDISWDVLSALDHAHSRELVHRDVKPSNILIETTGKAFLMDFGIALAMNQGTRLTKFGKAPGTPAYMSPEQIQGDAITTRSDIYSFGCVLYAMLTGHPPFPDDEGISEFQIKEWHVRNAPPPLREKNPAVSPALETVVMKCMAKKPEQRFPNCHAVMTALQTALDPAQPQPQPPVIPPVFVGGPPPPAPPQTGAWQAPPPPAPGPSPQQGHVPTILQSHPSGAGYMPSQQLPVHNSNPQGSQVHQPPQPPFIPPPQPFAQQPGPAAKGGNRGLLYALGGVALLAALGGAYWVWGGGKKDNTVIADAPVVLRLEGSTTVGDDLAPALIKAFLVKDGAKDVEERKTACGKDCNKIEVTGTIPGGTPQRYVVTANGSGKAFDALGANTADLGMSSRPAKTDEVTKLAGIGDLRSRSCEHVIALDGVAVVVNKGNSVRVLDRKQVGEIFRGKIKDWSEVGGKPGPIKLYRRNNDSGTHDTFAAMVLGGKKDDVAPSAQIKTNGDDIATAVSSDPGGIGYVALAQIKGVDPVAISDGEGTRALAPSVFTVSTEDYVLSRRLYFYSPAATKETASRFITFALGPEGQEVVRKNGFVDQTGQAQQVEIPSSAPSEYKSIGSGKRRMRINFRFRPNSKELDNKAEADIKRAIAWLSANNVTSGIYLFGFADSKGDDVPGGREHNIELSKERAEVVRAAFATNGLSNVEVRGFGSEMPVGDNGSDNGRDKNRRVEVWVP